MSRDEAAAPSLLYYPNIQQKKPRKIHHNFVQVSFRLLIYIL